MARPRSYKTEALVLKSIPWGEGGLLVTFYSKDFGKLRASARGIRKPSSKMVGHLEPLNKVSLALARPQRGGPDTVTQVLVTESFSSLKASLEGISRGVYVAELVDGFGTEGNPNPELYTLLLDTIRTLDSYPQQELILRYFELHLLRASGFMPELYHCVDCGQELLPGQHVFSPETGGTLCLKCTPPGPRILRLSLQTLKILRFLDRTSLFDLSNIRSIRGPEEEVKHLLFTTLNYWLDKEIRSKSFLEHLQEYPKIGV